MRSLKKLPLFDIFRRVSIISMLLPLFFGLILNFFQTSPAFADPTPNQSITTETNREQNSQENSNSSTTQPSQTEQNSTSETIRKTEQEPQTCTNFISGGIGYLICPVISAISEGVDIMYSAINNFLNIKPLTFSQDSPIFIVWQYFRDITNIVFIILLVIVVYSQLTGLGINNYNIKRILPRIIVAAILINLSFIICSIAIDLSNILGSSLRGFFKSIEDLISANTAGNHEPVSFASIATALTIGAGTIGITALAVSAAGGLSVVFWLFLPTAFGAIVAVVVGLLTISARHAVVALLTMVSPLAFVAYLLPNTEQYFTKWRKIFTQMLIFYPIFSILYGASSLASWAIITTAGDNVYEVILGIAIRIFPLFFSVKLLKMSDTILSNLSNALNKVSTPASKAVASYSGLKAAKTRADYYNKGAKQLNKLNGSTLYKNLANYQRKLKDDVNAAEQQRQALQQTYMNYRSLGKRVLGYDKDGNPVFTQVTYRDKMGNIKKRDKATISSEMRRDYENKQILNLQKASDLELEKEFNAIGDYLTSNGLDKNDPNTKFMENLKNKNLEAFLRIRAAQESIRANDLADNRWLHEQISKAAKRNEDGSLVDAAAYDKFITRAAGYDGLSDDNNIRNNALTGVISRSYEAMEAEQQANVKRYTSYVQKQVTPEIQRLYQGFIDDKNAEGIVALGLELRNRGDLNLFSKPLAEALDNGNYLELGTEFASDLAHLFLQMKGVDPTMARFGKHIMVETTRYINKDRASKAGQENDKYITMKEFFTGETLSGAKTKGDVIKYLAGTPFDQIDRTAFADLDQHIASYIGTSSAEDIAKRDAIYNSILPQLISAMPKFASGSEQIVNTMQYITGIKHDSSGNLINIEKSGINANEYTNMTKKYLKALTADHIINMKSDSIAAALDRFKKNVQDQNPKLSDAEVQKLANKQYVASFDKNALSTLKNTPDISLMKSRNKTIFEELGIL